MSRKLGDSRNLNADTKRLLATLCVLAPPVIAFGGVHVQTQVGLLVVYLLGFVGLVAARAKSKPLVWHPLPVIMLGLAALALLQTASLPIGVVAVLSHRAAEAAQAAAAVFGTTAATASISLDITASHNAALRWTVGAIGVLILLQIANRRGERRWLAWATVVIASLTLMTGAVQALLGVDSIYGLYTPHEVSAGIAGPFISSNHAAHLLLLGALVALPLRGRVSKTQQRWLAVLIAGFVLGMLANSARGALAGFAFGLAAHVHITRKQRSQFRTFAFLLLAACLLGVLFFDEGQRFFSRSGLSQLVEIDKLHLQVAVASLLPDFWATGIGADALGAVQVNLVPLTRTGPFHMRYVENEVLQLLLDFGVVLPLLLVGLVFKLVPKSRRRGTRGQAWWIVALGFGLYSFVSFPSVSVAILIPFVALLSVYGRRLRRSPLSKRKLCCVVAITAAFALLVVALQFRGPATSDLELEDIPAAATRSPLDGRHWWQLTRAAMALEANAEMVDAMLSRTEALAGNDYRLLLAIGRSRHDLNDDERSFELTTRAIAVHPPARAALTERVGWLPDVPSLVAAARDHPELLRDFVEALSTANREGELLQVLFQLDDTPEVIFRRVQFSRRLGHDVLTREMAYQVDSALAETAADCEFLRRAWLQVGDQTRALDRAQECARRFGHSARAVEVFVAQALESEPNATRFAVEIDDGLRQLNLLSSDDAARSNYQLLRSMSQAMGGHCRAAALSFELSRAHSARLRPWVLERCPNLVSGPP